ncbi:MAG: aminodeoxychorismate synthase component I [Betaproteobacteria bacterium]|nr:aminodeoxychorismate synthase component I [Betaproteobacteria bacterium]
MLEPGMNPAAGTVVLRDGASGSWLQFDAPRQIVVARRVAEVMPCLAAIDEATSRRGLFAAGCIAYEAAPAFDPAFETFPPGDFPLLWFGLYDHAHQVTLPEAAASAEALDWTPSVSVDEYWQAIAGIRSRIREGETYQVNYTMRLDASAPPDPWRLFLQMGRSAPHGAYLDTGDFAICSASPELFFRSEDGEITCRPMKGTAPRGRTTREDRQRAEALRQSEKDRAENVMIVDMIRNDLGRIAAPGTVRVSSLFDAEKYPTVWQMTSTVKARSGAAFTGILQALFPCASITGAPKVQTMRIIAGLETRPRNIYTGCIGLVAPDGGARFNVAIRTVLVSRATGRAEYGVGGGIVWDSSPRGEYDECLAKSRVLNSPQDARSFELLETLLWEPRGGYSLLERHLARLADSAGYFDYRCDLERVRHELHRAADRFGPRRCKVRLLVSADGAIRIEHEALPEKAQAPAPRRVTVSPLPVDSADPFLFHKTTHRAVYDSALARAGASGFDDAILWNERGFVTESCFSNVVLRLDGELATPPVECGLLDGTFRRHMIEKGRIAERKLTLDDLRRAEAVFLINSVRRWQEARVSFPEGLRSARPEPVEG